MVWGLVSSIQANRALGMQYIGMEAERVYVVEGVLVQDAHPAGGRYLFPLNVKVVKDKAGNQHSARFTLPTFASLTTRFLQGDRVCLRGRIIIKNSDETKSPLFYAEEENPAVLLKRPFWVKIRLQILSLFLKERKEPYQALLNALLLGVKDGLAKDVILLFQKSGTSHILALSGMHVGILVLLLNWLLSFFIRGNRLSCIISILLICYNFLAGPFPSLIRAVLMYVLHTVAGLLGRRISSIDLLATTFLCMTFLFPESIQTYSSVLSYTAVLGIFLVSPRLRRLLRPFLPEPLLTPVSLSLSAQAATAPLTAIMFGQVPLFGWLASIFLSPLIFVFLWIGIVFRVLLIFIPIPWARYLYIPMEFLYTVILDVVEIFSRTPSLRFY
jgi:ComEC/Rec2-related protein